MQEIKVRIAIEGIMSHNTVIAKSLCFVLTELVSSLLSNNNNCKNNHIWIKTDYNNV